MHVVAADITEHEALIPKWDVALEALVTEEFSERGVEMRIADFQRLAREYDIRFDDIIDTLFRMCIEGAWGYRNGDGQERLITQQDYEQLFVNGRTREKDMEEYDGGWFPLKESTEFGC